MDKLVILLIAAISLSAGCKQSGTTSVAARKDTLENVRKGFRSALLARGNAPQEYSDQSPPDNVKEVRYRSGDLELNAWMSEVPIEGPKRPAVVYLHGGWAFSSSDWSDAAPFIDAGFVVFMPMLRAENGNPGIYEGFLGEIDDAIAAGKYVANLSHVDANNVFLVGHSVGAVNVALASMLPSDYRAAAALSGYMELQDWPDSFPSAFVFDISNEQEMRVRNPMNFPHSLLIPITLYAEKENGPIDNNEMFADLARKAGKKCDMVVVDGDHMTMVKPAASRAAEWFKAITMDENSETAIAR